MVSGRGAQLNAGKLLGEACAATGLTDFGDPWFEGPLEALVGFINSESGLVAEDAQPVQSLIGQLGDRLKLVAYLKQYPEARQEKVDIAGMIIGLPRGGSTLLQRLLCTTDQVTAVYWWELLNPLPLPGEKRGDATPRHEMAKMAVDVIHQTWPEMVAMHPVDAMIYDEDSQIAMRSLLCMDFACYFWIPGYAFWLMEQDQTKAYEELRLWLQVLQHQDPRRRGRKWMLKQSNPIHGGGLDYMMKEFPEAKILMTHRAIEDVIGSFCSLHGIMVEQFSGAYTKKAVGPWAADWYRAGLQKMMAVRKTYPSDQFIDIQYKDVMSAPLEQFRYAMEKMGLPVRAVDEKAAADWMASHQRDTHPRHKYTPDDYGISKPELAEIFKFYRAAFLD